MVSAPSLVKGLGVSSENKAPEWPLFNSLYEKVLCPACRIFNRFISDADFQRGTADTEMVRFWADPLDGFGPALSALQTEFTIQVGGHLRQTVGIP